MSGAVGQRVGREIGEQLLPQDVLLDLSGRGEREGVDDPPVPGGFVRSEPFAAVREARTG